jgi:hypothetical protein
VPCEVALAEPPIAAIGSALDGYKNSDSTIGGHCFGVHAPACAVGEEQSAMTKSIQAIDWAALGANLGSTLLFTLLLLSPFLWGAAVWHWLLAVAIGLVLGVYFYIRRERFEEPGPDADETRFPR